MIRLISSALVAVLLLTGVALGAARGQARIAGQVVICSGQSVAVVAVDDAGHPVRSAHFCPDMALSLMAALAGEAPPLALPRAAGPMVPTVAVQDPAGRAAPAMQARGPPPAALA